jgi:hypothetical protein
MELKSSVDEKDDTRTKEFDVLQQPRWWKDRNFLGSTRSSCELYLISNSFI